MLISLMTLALAATPQDAAPAPAPRKMECNKGPVSKTLAALPWLAYGCTDNSTVLLVAPKDNPVTPFNFILAKSGADYTVYGQGSTGNQEAADSAAKTLKAMSQDQINTLAREVNR